MVNPLGIAHDWIVYNNLNRWFRHSNKTCTLRNYGTLSKNKTKKTWNEETLKGFTRKQENLKHM
jgi:hypothetical protein